MLQTGLWEAGLRSARAMSQRQAILQMKAQLLLLKVYTWEWAGSTHRNWQRRFTVQIIEPVTVLMHWSHTKMFGKTMTQLAEQNSTITNARHKDARNAVRRLIDKYISLGQIVYAAFEPDCSCTVTAMYNVSVTAHTVYLLQHVQCICCGFSWAVLSRHKSVQIIEYEFQTLVINFLEDKWVFSWVFRLKEGLSYRNHYSSHFAIDT